MQGRVALWSHIHHRPHPGIHHRPHVPYAQRKTNRPNTSDAMSRLFPPWGGGGLLVGLVSTLFERQSLNTHFFHGQSQESSILSTRPNSFCCIAKSLKSRRNPLFWKKFRRSLQINSQFFTNKLNPLLQKNHPVHPPWIQEQILARFKSERSSPRFY